MNQGAGEMARAVKCLPHKHGDLSSSQGDHGDPVLLVQQGLHSCLPSARSQTWDKGACKSA